MEKVKRLVEAGSTVSGAIKELLSQSGLTVAGFSDKYDRNRSNMNQVVMGTRAPTDADLDAFVSEFGGTPADWRELLHEAGRPTARAS
ncbi:MAG: hypothetical protein WEA80_01970 [Gemmatimonadaceae bacterium]